MNQTHFDTSEICYLHGVRHAIFSPGSRNAPLSISFHRHPVINTRVIIDERSAGFIALGLAQQTGTPVVLCCTSGTALMNYGPAIVEAHYQNIPLVILSADRPPEWIDQWDGQTIRQSGVFNEYVKKSFDLPVELSHPDAQWEYERKIAEACLLANFDTPGPVHINIPFREPFYPDEKQELAFSKGLRKIEIAQLLKNEDSLNDDLLEEWKLAKRKIILLGQGWLSEEEIQLFSKIGEEQNIPIISDVISNGQDITDVVMHQDLFLSEKENWPELEPDLVISFGKSLISKNLKLFLRNAHVKEWRVVDQIGFENPLKNLSRVIQSDIKSFLKSVSGKQSQNPEFLNTWKNKDTAIPSMLEQLNQQPYSEFGTFYKVMRNLPDNIDLHLANSMPVRFANFIGIKQHGIQVFANRGTSGIDGTNGTVVGHALENQRKVVLLTGDLSFLYDQNAFFHEYDLSNLLIIVFNNFGGGIFDLIPGPLNLGEKERETHFTTPHHRDMKELAVMNGFSYIKANDEVTLELALTDIYNSGSKPKLLEVQTDPKTNQKVYFKLKSMINAKA